MRGEFTCLVLSPMELGPGLAVAAARAGGVAILDREFCSDGDLQRACDHLRRLINLSGASARIGLRLRADQLSSSHDLLAELEQGSHWLILCGWDGPSLQGAQASLPHHARRTLLLEVTSARQLSVLDDVGLCCHGLVARGHESGGWVGEDSAFILGQKLLAALGERPVYVQGGIGIYSAAAVRALGAAGVVLDDQLWLMPESPLTAESQSIIARLSGQEAVVVGERLGQACRVLSRPGFAAAAALQERAEEMELQLAEQGPRTDATVSGDASERWRELVQLTVGWGEHETRAWPLGQAAGLAERFRAQYKTTGRFIQALLRASAEHIETARSLRPLQADSPLAALHGTRYPIVQGPMTRVSDTAQFADAVARAGGLPLLALAMMSREQIGPLLRETERLMNGRAWGVGILGFVPPQLREEQVREVLEVKPPFALIAGGRPDQAMQLESQGIAAYIHVPVPSLLRMFLAQGARRFVFEGRECGGHVGPLTSFMLWESMIETLLEEVEPSDAGQVCVLFAGGIHDARSAAVVSVMAAPLIERGMRIGVLMGTAYLFTREAVDCGAIVKTFQDQAISCDRTVNIETGPGHAIRCIVTPFASEFYDARRRALKVGTPPAEMKETLESLTVGRLRIASKGLAREDGGRLARLGRAAQLDRGMYMIGQVATMREGVCSIEELHRNVSEASTEMLLALPRAPGRRAQAIEEKPSEIAIIGISTLLPKAEHAQDYWENILRQVDAITEIPEDRWDWRLYYDPDRKARDKIYSRWGGFLGDVPFDPLRFGIPPKSMKSIGCSQLLTLEAVRRALADAGYESGDFDRERTSVILGSADTGGALGNQYITRTLLPLFVPAPEEDVWDRLPEWTEESLPGMLVNVTAGRVANRFDLGGSNFTVDAACASSLTVIDVAVKELESGRSNLVIAGGVDTGQTPCFYIAFSKTQAFSPTGRTRTFDKSADGIIISEGIAIVILKRLADAERDGDRIYAVIKGVACSSDGKALGLTAPRPLGQRRTFERAYQKANIGPSTLGMYEAHGTGTVVGDRAELETIISTLEADDAESRSCALGSVKTLIGHTKTTAGVAGMVKAALALYHKTLPPHAGVDRPLEPIADSRSPVYLLKQARPWLLHPDYPRRSGVSAFGFGGTNAHAVLEEYQGESRERASGSETWPCELVLMRAPDRPALVLEIKRLLSAFESGAEPRLRDLAYSYAMRAQGGVGQSLCLCIVAGDLRELREALALSLKAIEADETDGLPANIVLARGPDRPHHQPAFVFPGQGAQYPNMAREASLFIGELRAALEFADRRLRAQYERLLSQYIYPPSAFSQEEEKRQLETLTETHLAQPAIGVISLGFLDLAARLGLQPAMVCGHSYGEFTALYAAGVLSREDFLSLSEKRGRAMSAACEIEGMMVMVRASREDVSKRLKRVRDVVIANHNAPLQTIISGRKKAVERFVAKLSEAGISSSPLPVAGPFHSPLMASAAKPLSEAIAGTPLRAPKIPVYSNATARPFAADEEQIRKGICDHLLSPVKFLDQINRMYEDGARIFVELGPKSTLTGLIGQILAGREHTAVSLEGHGGGMRGLLIALGTLLARGVALNLQALYERRDVRPVDLQRLAETTARAELPPSAWLVNGATARPQNEQVGYTGTLPLLNRETAMKKENAPQAAQARALLDQTTAGPDAPSPSPKTQLPSAFVHGASSADMSAHDMAGGAAATNRSGEILAAYQAYQETMRRFLVLQEDALRQFLGGQPAGQYAPPQMRPQTDGPPTPHPSGAEMEREAPGRDDSQVSAPDESQDAPQIQASQPDRKALSRRLVQFVSERTGYPADMLGMDLDLEAELGVDSIKRIEILDALQKSLPAALGAIMQERTDSFTRVKSLNGLVDVLLREVFGAAQSAVGPATVDERQAIPAAARAHDERPASQALAEAWTHATDERAGACAEVSPEEACPRYLMRAQAEPLPWLEESCPDGLFLITEDKLGVAACLSHKLRRRGVRTGIIKRANLAAPEKLERLVTGLSRKDGPVRGIVHLAALAKTALPETLRQWREEAQVQSGSLFQLLQLAGEQLQDSASARTSRVLSASLFGGSFGRDGSCGPGLPLGGSGVGFLKTVEKEWSGVPVRAVDFDDASSPEEMADNIVRELLSARGPLEVGYPLGQRTVFRAVSASTDISQAPRQAVTPASDWVVMLTGGARGITAEIASALALPGMKMLLVGRSPEPEKESSLTEGVEDVAALRRLFLDQAKTAGASRTPAQIEGRVRELLRDRSIRRNLQRLRRAGVSAEYHAVDVRDEAAFGSLIEGVYARHGRLDALIHGAGIIEDKLLLDKSLDSFDRVFETKVSSAFILNRYLRPESLKLMVLFSSIAGRFGNRGQADYAGANEVLNRFAWRWKHDWPATRVVSINWGPWDVAGMASAEVNSQLRERGIMPIPTGAGTKFFVEELKYGSADAVEVIAGQGPWEDKNEEEGGDESHAETVAEDEIGDMLACISELTESFWTM